MVRKRPAPRAASFPSPASLVRASSRLKGRGYGCLFSLTGLDEEALTDLELEARVRQVEGALRGLPEGSCLYQYTRVMSGFDLPRQKQYANEVTETFAGDRLTHLDKTAAFRRHRPPLVPDT